MPLTISGPALWVRFEHGFRFVHFALSDPQTLEPKVMAMRSASGLA